MSFKKFAMVALAGAALAMDSMGGMPDSGSGMESSAAVAPTVAETTEAAPMTTEVAQGGDASSSAAVATTAEGTAASPIDPMSTADAASMDATASADDMTTMSTSVMSMDSMPMGTGGAYPNASSTGSIPISGSDAGSGVSIVLIIASTMLGGLFVL